MNLPADYKRKWEIDIGRIFLAFGSIEDLTIQIIDHTARDKIIETAKKLPLTTRIDLIIEILSIYHHPSIDELVVYLKKAKTLSKKRNLVAHNPFMLEGYTNKNNEMHFKEKIESLRNPNSRIKYDELHQLAEDAEKLAGKLFVCDIDAFNAIRSTA